MEASEAESSEKSSDGLALRMAEEHVKKSQLAQIDMLMEQMQMQKKTHEVKQVNCGYITFKHPGLTWLFAWQLDAKRKADEMAAVHAEAHAKAQARIQAKNAAQGPDAIARAYARVQSEGIVIPAGAGSNPKAPKEEKPWKVNLETTLEPAEERNEEKEGEVVDLQGANVMEAIKQMRDKQDQDAMALLMAGDGVMEAMAAIKEHKATLTIQRFGRYVLARKQQRRRAAIQRLNLKRLKELEVTLDSPRDALLLMSPDLSFCNPVGLHRRTNTSEKRRGRQ